MSRFRLHIKENKRDYRNWLALGIVGLLLIAGSVTIHSMGIVRAKSRETVLLYTEEEFEQYLLCLLYTSRKQHDLESLCLNHGNVAGRQ